jgi:hypothetical protein
MDNEVGLADRLRCQKQVKRDSFMEVFAGDSDLPHSSRLRRCDAQKRLEGGRLFLTTLKGGGGKILIEARIEFETLAALPLPLSPCYDDNGNGMSRRRSYPYTTRSRPCFFNQQQTD